MIIDFEKWVKEHVDTIDYFYYNRCQWYYDINAPIASKSYVVQIAAEGGEGDK